MLHPSTYQAGPAMEPDGQEDVDFGVRKNAPTLLRKVELSASEKVESGSNGVLRIPA